LDRSKYAHESLASRRYTWGWYYLSTVSVVTPPSNLKNGIAAFVGYFNNAWYHEAMEKLTPTDVYFVREKEGITRREKINRRILEQCRKDHS